MDINAATSFYTAPAIQKQIALNRQVVERVSKWPHHETEHAIAVIIDDSSPLYENFTVGFQNLALLRQRIEGLQQCGIPYREYLLSDLRRENFPSYRCYLFPNLFRVDDETIALLRRKVLRDGHIAIFGPGTGITDGENVSAAGAEKLLGIPMKLYPFTSARRVRLRDRSLLPLRDVQQVSTFGDSLMYGPILAPDPERIGSTAVQVLGDAVFNWQVNAPGLALREFGRGGAGNGKGGAHGADDYAVAFSGAIPLPPSLLRSLARYGGCNVWCERDIVLAASDSLVSLHTLDSGTFTIKLPRRVRRVVDATTGQTVAHEATRLRVKMASPDTKLFLLFGMKLL